MRLRIPPFHESSVSTSPVESNRTRSLVHYDIFSLLSRLSDVTNADVAAALEFPHLRRLDLANTRIDDDAFSGLSDSTNWRIGLNLTNTNVSAIELTRTKFHSVYIGLNQFSPSELKMIREYTLVHVGERFPDFE